MPTCFAFHHKTQVPSLKPHVPDLRLLSTLFQIWWTFIFIFSLNSEQGQFPAFLLGFYRPFHLDVPVYTHSLARTRWCDTYTPSEMFSCLLKGEAHLFPMRFFSSMKFVVHTCHICFWCQSNAVRALWSFSQVNKPLKRNVSLHNLRLSGFKPP